MTTTPARTTPRRRSEVPVGLNVLLAALLTIGSVFTGANGLPLVSVIAMVAAVVAGTAAIVLGTREREDTGSLMIGLGASTLSLLAGVCTWTSSFQLPFGVTLVLAVVPAVAWAGFWWVQLQAEEPEPESGP